MEDELANLNLADDEEEAVYGQEEEGVEEEFNFFMVGRVFIKSAVHFPLIKNVLAELWHPIEGVTISEIEDKRVLFRFYNKIDVQRVVDGLPWFFNRHLIIFHRLMKGEDPVQVQIHNLPPSFMSEGMTKQLVNFIEDFLDYDALLATKREK
ncbi:hypothetical protein J1N35_028371 [Gossypium stocksii]|uniref:DUF4283 domain-containing protein n=1 Tax=Gossypium stocksii TaxID=47602 RepID=A0A9D3ZRX4_9ROSI|nr:hypothetical protein J1N35_028371 [Gossypium stocksii]